jgi:hypothetical protein
MSPVDNAALRYSTMTTIVGGIDAFDQLHTFLDLKAHGKQA